MICLLYEGLTRCKTGNEVELALATRVEISPDQMTYLFHLRPSFWSDGYPVTAYDFEASWKEILTPGFPSLCAYLLYPIQNAELSAKGLVSPDALGIFAVDAHTLKITLEKPTPYFLALTAFPLFLPHPSHLAADAPLITNGPFTLDHWTPNREIVLQKNPTFWDARHLSLDKIHIALIPNEMTALNLFEKGELDILGSPLSPLPLDAIPAWQGRGLQCIPLTASTFCIFNQQKGPFQNENLRKALILAIDPSQAILPEMGHLLATHPLPPALLPADTPPLPLSYDRATARELFRKALQELGSLEELTLVYKGGPAEKRVAQTLQRQWIEALGLEVGLEQLDAKTHLQKLHEKNYQLSLTSWISQFPDPINILERFKDSHHPKNYAGWENRLYQKLVEEKKFLQAERILLDEAVILPLYHWSAPTLSSPRVASLPINASGAILFEKINLLDESSAAHR